MKNTVLKNIPFINLLFINIQSLANKIEELEIILNKYNYNVLCIAEHWQRSQEIMFSPLEGFKLGNSFCRSQNVHGGVCIFLAHNLAFKTVDLSRFSGELDFEVTGVEIVTLNLIIICIYRSPRGKVDIFLRSLENMLRCLMNKKCKIIIVGDVNAEFDVTSKKKTAESFVNMLRQFNMYCANDSPTRGKSCLDNVMTNLNKENCKCTVLKLDLSDHDALQFKVKGESFNIIQGVNGNMEKIRIRPVTKGKINKFEDALRLEDWTKLLLYNGANDSFEYFFERFLTLFEWCFPTKDITPKCKSIQEVTTAKKSTLGWYTPLLSQMKQNLLICKDMCRRDGGDQFASKLRTLRQQYRQALREAKKRKNEEVIEKASNKCRAAWKIINRVAGKVPHASEETSIQPDDFNSFLISSVEEVYGRGNASTGAAMECLEKVNSMFPPGCVFSQVSTCDVLKSVMAMKSSTSRDIYGLSSDVLKSVIYNILEPLTYVLNQCILEGVFPTSLKISRIVPIFKKGDPEMPSSYRPISCIPVFAKVFEKILKIQICYYFECYNLFSGCQFGYRSGKSTIQAVDNLIQELLRAFEKGNLAQITLCDLSSAFDTVNHEILLSKLRWYGFCGKDLDLFSSYLTNRKQVVEVKGTRSKISEVKMGVPQGSVLGPILFLIMINDLSFNISCFSTIYADDTSLLNIHNSVDEVKLLSQNSLSEAISWFGKNGLFLNLDKTQKLNITLRREVSLNCGDVVTLLGIDIDHNLSWRSHISKIYKKLSKILYLLVNLKRNVTYKYLRMAYFAFFESIARYGIIVWGNGVGLDKILVLQKKVIRIIMNAKPLEHCKPLFRQSRILTIVNLYIYDVLILVRKNLKSHPVRNGIHTHDTRCKNKLELPRCRLTKTMNYHTYLGIKLYNKLPMAWLHFNERKFAKVLYSWLVDNPFYKIEEFYNCNVT